MKIYFLRHQAAGVLTEYPFASEPTAEQIAPIKAMLDARCGELHAKTKEPLWLRVVEQNVVAAGEMPVVDKEERKLSAVSSNAGDAASGAPRYDISGTGTVTNPVK